VTQETVEGHPLGADGPQNPQCFGAHLLGSYATPDGAKQYPSARSPDRREREDDETTQAAIASPEAIAAARDLAFEGLVEAGSLAESYSRSLAEAAWRGDQATVEVHLRQLRDCVVAGIGIFKELGGVEAKGGQQ
jgi:hypothetical protein